MLFPAETRRRRGNRREHKNTSDWSSLRLSLRLCVSAGNSPLRWFRLPQLSEYSYLLLLRLFRRRFFHVGSGFLQIVDNLGGHFIDAGLAVPLREILRPLLADGDFFVALAAARDHACHHDGFSTALFGEFGSRQIAQFVDQGLHAQVVHGLAVGGPLVARLGVAFALDLNLAR